MSYQFIIIINAFYRSLSGYSNSFAKVFIHSISTFTLVNRNLLFFLIPFKNIH